MTAPYNAQLCALLRARRLQLGLDQRVLAGVLRRPQSYVSRYERGDRQTLSMDELIILCRVLGIAPLELVRDAIAAVDNPARRRAASGITRLTT